MSAGIDKLGGQDKTRANYIQSQVFRKSLLSVYGRFAHRLSVPFIAACRKTHPPRRAPNRALIYYPARIPIEIVLSLLLAKKKKFSLRNIVPVTSCCIHILSYIHIWSILQTLPRIRSIVSRYQSGFQSLAINLRKTSQPERKLIVRADPKKALITRYPIVYCLYIDQGSITQIIDSDIVIDT